MGATSSDSFLQPYDIEEYGETICDHLDINASVLEKLIVHKERMKELVHERFSTANNLADMIVKELGLSFRKAHHVAGRVVRICLGENIAPIEVTGEVVDRAAMETIGEHLNLPDEIVKRSLDPMEFIKTRTTIGSTNPEEVKRQIRDGKEKLKKQERWLRKQKNRVQNSMKKLNDSMEGYIKQIH
jgi:argininosuccinate lyase